VGLSAILKQELSKFPLFEQFFFWKFLLQYAWKCCWKMNFQQSFHRLLRWNDFVAFERAADCGSFCSIFRTTWNNIFL
jgi:hypothetical protein